MNKKTSSIGKRRAAAKAKLEASGTYQRRRREISEAAARVFNEKGFQGTTISAVADELHIDRASIYYYISSKDELFDEVIREASEDNVAKAQRIQRSDAPPSDKLRSIVRGLMESYAATYPLLYIYIREDLNHVSDKRSEWAKQMRKINRDYDDAFTSIIEEGYADGSFSNLGPARVVAYGIIGMLNWTNRWFKPQTSKLSSDQIGDMFAELVTAGLENGSLALDASGDPATAKTNSATASKPKARAKAKSKAKAKSRAKAAPARTRSAKA